MTTPLRGSTNINNISTSPWWNNEEDVLASAQQEDSFSIPSASDPLSNWSLNGIDWEKDLQAPTSCPHTPEHDALADESGIFSTPKMETTDPNIKASISSDLVTPEKLRTAVHVFKDGQYTLCSPLSKDRIKIDAGLQALHQMHTPGKKRKAEKLLEEVISQLAPEIDPYSVEFHEKAESTLLEDEISDTAKKIIRTSCSILNESPRRIVPMSHLIKRTKTGGFHLDLGTEDHKITPIAENPLTKIRYVRVDDAKNSTLFPIGTTKKQVIELVSTAKKIVQQENRSLRKTSEGYMIECYIDRARGDIAFSSTFPLFFFAEFSLHTPYELTESFSISSEDALQAAMSTDAAIQYRTYNDMGELEQVFVDIAPIFKGKTGVDKGIMLQFDRVSAPDLFAFYRNTRPEIFYQT